MVFDHTFNENDGEGENLRELTAKPTAPQLKNWKIYPKASGWSILSAANVERFLFGVATKTEIADFNFAEETIIFGDASAGNVIGTLPPAAASKDQIYFAKKIEPIQASKRFRIAAQPGEFIDHASFVDLSARDEFVVLVSDGTRWRIIG